MEYFSDSAPEKVGNSLARGRQGQPQANSVRKLCNKLWVCCHALNHFVIRVYSRRTLRVEVKKPLSFVEGFEM